MFIGHYGPAFAGKALGPGIPLWLLFVAVQGLDIGWAILVLAGIEKLRILPGFTEGSAFDLYYMPYTHGLIGALVISTLLGGTAALFLREARTGVFLIIAGATFSHWLLDLVVHVPDLPLYDDSAKLGLGLWRHIWLSLPLELALLMLGGWLYARMVPARRARGDRWLWLFLAAMTALEIYSATAPPPASSQQVAISALAAYLVLAVFAGLVDLARGTRSAVQIDHEDPSYRT
ncbi:MAG: hypothetical protein ACLQJR_02840 [Stellaceae bacterium]